MRRLLASIALLALALGSSTYAQDGDDRKKVEPGQERSALTPDMRAYLDELRRQDDPKLNARRAAMFKAEQRRLRLASQQWYGYSNLRPMANPTPFMGTYSPVWAGSSYNEYQWYGGGYSPTTIYLGRDVYYTR
jgi:hypothetical protein